MTIIAAVVLALLFRMACPGRSRTPLNLPLQLLSGLWLGIAAWVLGGLLLHAWVPIWQMLVVGFALAAIGAAFDGRFSKLVQPAEDFIAVAMLAPLSVIPVRVELVIAAALAFAAAGFALDALTSRLRPRLQWAALAMPAVLVVLLGTQVRQPGNFGSRLLERDPLFPLRLVLVTPSAGTRVPLESGATAWMLRTQAGNPRGTAIVMHGNHRLGSRQPSSVALHGALMRAGYHVLSVDHTGFGASVPPDASAEWTVWDPTIGPTQALELLSRENNSQPPATIVVGHSMGVDVVLKFVADGNSVAAAYVFGGSLDRPYGPNWLDGFHRERNIPCCLPPPTLNRIRDEFYGGGDRFAAAMPEGHAKVHYIRFGLEHADVTRDREPLYAAITPPKKACDFANVSHYFNTLSLRRFVLLDARTIKRTADIFAPGEQAEAACSS